MQTSQYDRIGHITNTPTTLSTPKQIIVCSHPHKMMKPWNSLPGTISIKMDIYRVRANLVNVMRNENVEAVHNQARGGFGATTLF